MEITTKLVQTAEGYFYIPIPEDLIPGIRETFGKRVLCKINDGLEIHCAIQRNDRIGHYIMLSKKKVKQVDADPGDVLELILREDSTQYQSPMPEELQAVLDTDPEGMLLFEKLTDGKKRGIMHHINSAKAVDTRINRALRLMKNLKRGATTPKGVFLGMISNL